MAADRRSTSGAPHHTSPPRARHARAGTLRVAKAVAGLAMSALLTACGPGADPNAAPLQTAAAVSALGSAEAAAGRPVRIAGRVTYADGEWRMLVVQDATGTVLVDPGDEGFLPDDGS